MNPQTHTLDNGLRLVTLPMKGNPTATVLVMVSAGTKYEEKSRNGISHFLEHMCFKGTKNRSRSLDIANELDGLGAASNAFTWYEYTGYYAKAQKKHFPELLDVVSDIYLNPLFPENELEKEKGVIIEEINMYEDLPMSHIREVLYSLMYGDQPAGWAVLGEKENIQSMKREDFVSYYKDHYVPQATTVVVAGDVDPEDVSKRVETYFGNLRQVAKKEKQAVTEKQTEPQLLLKHKDTDQSHFSLGFRSYPLADDRSSALDILATILGKGTSSRLFQKLREEMGVCYYVKSENEQYTDTGIFKISSGVDTSRLEEVVEVILGELRTVRDDAVDEVELMKAKEHFIGNMLMGLESSDEQAFYYGEQMTLEGTDDTPAQKTERIKAVTAEEVQRVAQEVFKNGGMNLAVIGPTLDESGLRKILTL